MNTREEFRLIVKILIIDGNNLAQSNALQSLGRLRRKSIVIQKTLAMRKTSTVTTVFYINLFYYPLLSNFTALKSRGTEANYE